MDARELTAALGGRWRGRHGVARCPAHPDRTPSLAIRQSGDAVLVCCHGGCDQRSVIEALRDRDLWPSRDDRRPAPRKRSTRMAPPPERDPELERNRARALEIWHAAHPAPGTLVESYLRSRAITDPPPPSLRFAPGLKHGPTSMVFPCMVAAVQGLDRGIVGVHRTFLRPDGEGKARVSSPKMSLGPIAGGAVRLGRAVDNVQLAEGIETALAVQQATGQPTWAALGTSGLKALRLPDHIRSVVILADGDDAGEAAATEAADRWRRQGRGVRIARAPRGFDFADVLAGKAAGRVAA